MGTASTTTTPADSRWKPPSVTLGRPAPAAVVELVKVLNMNLGEGIFAAPNLQRDLQDASVLVTGADADGKVVGGAVARLLVPADVDYYRRFGAAASEAFRDGPIGSVEALAVVPFARRSGTGRRLLLESLEWCRERGCRHVVAVSWISGGGGTSAGLFAAAGFTMGETIAEFYLNESLRDGWLCPACGAGCRCGGQFVYRRLDA
ncbi:MAG TPA: GNAT family N-acetyltransferase [Candidatus Dormibacteraeota bacterium]|nr:GNAT family N-acetyltransferase [Candidatus Dormibacteraeota bacterium]